MRYFINTAIYLTLLLLLQMTMLSCGRKSKEKIVSQKVMVDNLPEVVETPVDVTEDSAEVAMLREFYSACLSPHFRGNEQFYAKYMTEAIQEKVWRMSAEVDANAIIRAQDVPEDSCATLEINPLENSWYMVSYIFGKGGPYEEKCNIPVKVVQENGRYRIGYITPYCQKQAYGDSLWYSKDTFPSVERSEPLAFVKSFYDLYTAKYSSLLPNLQQELATIRAEYLTPKAQEQFAKAEAFNRVDCGGEGYDLLIGRFDFLNQWRSAIKVNPTDKKGIYCMNYYSTPIWVEVVEKEGKYFINSIYNEDSEHSNNNG